MSVTNVKKNNMEKITTTSDVELVIVLLTQDGREELINGKKIESYHIINPTEKYIKVRCRIKGDKEFVVEKQSEDTEGIIDKWYLSTTSFEEIDEVPCFVVTIPSNTFTTRGVLEVAVMTKEYNENFSDEAKDMESIFERTEVCYVYQ